MKKDTVRLPESVVQVLGISPALRTSRNVLCKTQPSDLGERLQKILKESLDIEEPKVISSYEDTTNEVVYIYRSPYVNGLRVTLRERNDSAFDGAKVYSVYAKFPALPSMLTDRYLDYKERRNKEEVLGALKNFFKKTKYILDKHYFYISRDGRIY